MAAVVAPNASPAELLHSLRGSITAARRAYPDVLHVEVQDSRGDLWRLATQDADWFPPNPSRLVNLSIEAADLDEETGELRLALAGGSSLRIVPAVHEARDDPPNWKLLTPKGLVLVFGPAGRWQMSRADEPIGLPPKNEVSGNEPPAWSQALAMNSHVLFEEHARYAQLFFVLSIGLPIISVVIAAISLVFALR